MSNAAELVTNGYNSFFGFASTAFATTSSLLSSIGSFDVEPVSVNVQYNFPSAQITPFSPPAAPETPEFQFSSGDAPADPSISAPSTPSIGAMPTFNGDAPAITLPARPTSLAVTPPGAAPTIAEQTFPNAPNIDSLSAPQLRDITIPDSPTLAFPSFEGIAPILNIDVPSVGITWSEAKYSSALLAETTARVRSMLVGGTGLPAPVESALFERAKGRLDVSSFRAVQEATEQWSARGFSEPGGELAARLREVREQNRDATNTLNRDILIRVHEVEVENLRFAVQQGVALESMLIEYEGAYAARALEAQRLVVQAAIDVYNARINLYNAGLSAYRTQAEVFRTLIDAERTKVEVFRAQVEAAVAEGTLNESMVRAYAEQVRAQGLRVDIYEAQIRGVQAKVEADKARVEAFRATVQAYAEQVGAKKAEFEAYGEEVRAQASIGGIYESQVRAFAERVRAYAAGTEAAIAPARFEVERGRMMVEQFTARVGAFREKINAEAARASAAASIYDGKARIYTAQLGAEGARVEATTRQFEAEVQNNRNQAEIALRNASLNVENAIRAAEISLESLKAQATVGAQLAAGALSAVNLSAGISGSSSQSTSVDYNVDGGSASPPILG